MNLEKYDYKYALIPHAEAKKRGLGWRKADHNGKVMINLSELKQLSGEGSIEERVEAIGGHIMLPDEAYYYRHTNTFAFVPDAKPQEQEQGAPQLPDGGTDTEEIDPGFSQDVRPDGGDGSVEEIDPGFTQGGTQTEFPPVTDTGTEEVDPGFSQQPLSPEEVSQLEQQLQPSPSTEESLNQELINQQ